jgi:manganese oxidase
MLSEWDVKPGTYRPDPRSTDLNTFTFNAKSFPATEPLVVGRGDRVRVRFANLSAMDHHPIHLHGHAFWVTQTDGGVIPRAARWPETTVLVAAGQSRTIDFVADNPGDWAFHCHMTHHVTNQMGHQGPNMVGADPAKLRRAIKPLIPGYQPVGTTGMENMSEMQTGAGDKGGHSERIATPENSIVMMGGHGPHGTIDMGGMLTILKVREHLTSLSDPGWYEAPRGTVAQPASNEDLERDGIKT